MNPVEKQALVEPYLQFLRAPLSRDEGAGLAAGGLAGQSDPRLSMTHDPAALAAAPRKLVLRLRPAAAPARQADCPASACSRSPGE